MASEAEERWIAQVVETGDYRQATRDCYPDVSEKWQASKTSQLKARHLDTIDAMVRDSYKADAPEMRLALITLARHAKQESVKLKAITDWLSRAGHNPVNEHRDLTPKPDQAELVERLKLAMTGIEPETLKQVLSGDQILELAREATKDQLENLEPKGNA